MNNVLFYEINTALSKYGKIYREILSQPINNIQADQYQISQFKSLGKKVFFVHCSFLRYGDILDLSPADLVVVVDTEIIPGNHNKFIKDLKKLYNNSNVIIITGGCRLPIVANLLDVYVHPLLMLSSCLHNQTPEFITQILPTRNFDVLLGQQKDHRQFVLNNIIESQLEDQCWINMTTNNFINEPVQTIYRTPEMNLLEPTTIKNQLDKLVTFDSYKCVVNSNGNLTTLSSLIPWKIYNHSYWSVLTESDERVVYFTEKTGKALLARRPFVFFGAQYSLRQLKNWGFKTFNSVIDESYDNVSDPVQRWQQAFDQIKYLSQQPLQKINESLQPVLDHNEHHYRNSNHLIGCLKDWLMLQIKTKIPI